MNEKIEYAKKKLRNGEPLAVWFDLDGTLCRQYGKQYDKAEPIPEMIELARELYDMGCFIIITTARGATSGVDWKELTEEQLLSWDVKYHQLLMGLPRDLYIGDESLQPKEFLRLVNTVKQDDRLKKSAKEQARKARSI